MTCGDSARIPTTEANDSAMNVGQRDRRHINTMRRYVIPCAVATCLLMNGINALFSAHNQYVTADNSAKRPVAVADVIGMSSVDTPIEHFSRDGNKLVTVLRKGDLAHNTVAYSMLMWNTNEIFHSSTPKSLVTLSSSSNREAIEAVTWLADNKTVMFLGETPGSTHQVYSINVDTGRMTRVTNHPTNITSYSATPDGNAVAYTAEEPDVDLFDHTTRREGFVVSTEALPQLLAGRRGGGGFFTDNQLFIRDSAKHVRKLVVSGKLRLYSGVPALSPDGQYVAILSMQAEVPPLWKGYTDDHVRLWTRQVVAPGEYSYLERYDLIDARSGKSRVLLNSPIGYGNSEAVWLPDSRSVVVSNTFLPLDSVDAEELKQRQSAAVVVEVAVSTGGITTITKADIVLKEFNSVTNQLDCVVGRSDVYGTDSGRMVSFHKKGSEWVKVVHGTDVGNKLEITVSQDMNTPPRVLAREPSTNRKVVLLDPNPQFKRLKFGNVQEIKWNDAAGRSFVGGLYYPIDYLPSTRYPLVIQTHGWTANQFWIDGPAPTGFAAQALVGQGIMVLQVDEDYVTDSDTSKEVDREVSRFESAVAYLNKRGLIDPSRVGIIGFSRTCLFVKYALTHPTVRFAAAAVSEGVDGGYFQYLVYANSMPGYNQFHEGVNGGLPFGDGLKSWMARSPGFNIDKVQTPLRITADSPEALLFEWEWFAAMRRLGEPVELAYMPDGAHVLQKPWDRMVSQQGNVDWFVFWLKGEEDPASGKREQYARWRKLRDAATINVVGATAPFGSSSTRR